MSIERFFPNPASRQRLRAGPLARDVDAFAAHLAAEGYACSVARNKLWFFANLSRWLSGQQLSVEALDEQRVKTFLCEREPHHRLRINRSNARQLLSWLRGAGRIPAALCSPADNAPIERVARRYERFLLNERGLKPTTVAGYVPTVRAFLANRFGTGDIALESLSARDANQFILREAQRLSRSRARGVGTVLRSFLRHLHQCGAISTDLAATIPSVVNWRQAGPPKAIPLEAVEALLAGCDRGTVAGRRDYAILLLQARLGLRGGEITALTLDDFDWSAGIVSVPGKGDRREPLPLPRDVGEAVTDYLRNGRPLACPTRRVFIHLHAPHRGLSSTAAIGGIVRRALARAELDPPCKGAHLLRHSLATGMLRNGATLEDIGQILRHRHPDTTQIYAQVDFEALRSVAASWPGGAP